MLQRLVAKGRTLQQATRAAQNCSKSPFATLTKTGIRANSARHAVTRRFEADRTYQPGSIMGISSAGNPGPKTDTYLDFMSEPDIDFEHIMSKMTCTKFRDSIWGFVIYRCSQGHQAAWDRLLQALRTKLQEDLRFYIREDMLELHDLHAIEDETLYGATSHQVRDHFRSWVPKNLQDRLRPDATKPDDDVDWMHATSTPRYEYCLFADELCLESMDHPGVDFPVVKLLHKDWETPFPPEERNYAVPSPFHDGATEYDEEDVGWMYMPLREYLNKYDMLGKCDWDAQYVRPPYIDGSEVESQFVGHWRQESLSKGI